MAIAAIVATMCVRAIGSNGSASSSSPSAPAPTEVVIEAKLSEILGAYKGNEVRADNQYKDKVVRVSGQVDDVKKDITDSVYVTIGTGEMFEIPQIQCMVADGEDGKAANLSKGQRVTVQGRVSGLMMNVLMRDCHLQ